MGRKLLRDQARVKLNAGGPQVDAVFVEQLWPVDGLTVPVDQGRVPIARDA
jgi:hypothetical protein